MSKVIVRGRNFGGLVAALSIRHELKDEVDVTVISPSDRFEIYFIFSFIVGHVTFEVGR